MSFLWLWGYPYFLAARAAFVSRMARYLHTDWQLCASVAQRKCIAAVAMMTLWSTAPADLSALVMQPRWPRQALTSQGTSVVPNNVNGPLKTLGRVACAKLLVRKARAVFCVPGINRAVVVTNTRHPCTAIKPYAKFRACAPGPPGDPGC